MATTLEAVIAYIKAKFPDTDVQVDDRRLSIGDMSLLVWPEFLETVEPEEVPAVLDWLNIAEELRRAQGLPMILTEHGLKLESSN